MIHYFIEVSIAWALFYAIYFIFLKRETFFNINRWYLLHTIWIGAVIPFVRKIPISLESVEPMIMQPVQLIHYSTYAFSEAMAVPVEESMFNYQYLVYGLYFLGLMFFSVKFFYGLKNIWKLWRSGEKVIHDDFTMVLSDEYHLPFSFLKFVFLHRSFLEDDAISEIINHEMIHVKSRHTFDVLFFELVSILFWWNPIIYFYKKEIRQTHEYVADAYASQSTHIKNYGQILLGQSSSGIELALSNQFFNSYLKKRINMLYKKKSAHYKLSKYLLVIPILFFLCVLYSFKNNSEGTKPIVSVSTGITTAVKDFISGVTEGCEGCDETTTTLSDLKMDVSIPSQLTKDLNHYLVEETFENSSKKAFMYGETPVQIYSRLARKFPEHVDYIQKRMASKALEYGRDLYFTKNGDDKYCASSSPIKDLRLISLHDSNVMTVGQRYFFKLLNVNNNHFSLSVGPSYEATPVFDVIRSEDGQYSFSFIPSITTSNDDLLKLQVKYGDETAEMSFKVITAQEKPVATEDDDRVEYIHLHNGKVIDIIEYGNTIQTDGSIIIYEDPEEIYRLFKVEAHGRKVINFIGNIISEKSKELSESKLYQNVPNPFTETTSISFDLEEAVDASITIVNVQGEKIKNYSGNFKKGKNEIIVKGEDLPIFGVYYYSLEADGFRRTMKLVYSENEDVVGKEEVEYICLYNGKVIDNSEYDFHVSSDAATIYTDDQSIKEKFGIDANGKHAINFIGNLNITKGDTEAKLYQNVPNPFVETTIISFDLEEAVDASITIVNVQGEKIKNYSGNFKKGKNEIIVKGEDLPGFGVYYYSLEADGFRGTMKFVYSENQKEIDKRNNKLKQQPQNNEVQVAATSFLPATVKNPMIIIDGKISESKNAHYFTQSRIKSTKALTKEESISKYGDRSQDGALEVVMHSEENRVTTASKSGEDIFKIVEEMPRYPGCEVEGWTKEKKYKCAQENLIVWIYENLKYTDEAVKNKVEGKVYAQFIVEKDGAISNINVVRDIGYGCGDQVKKLLSVMPKWIPGKQRGVPVRVLFTLPVKFMIDSDEGSVKPIGISRSTFDSDCDDPVTILDGRLVESLDIEPDQIKEITVYKQEVPEKYTKYKNHCGIIEVISKNPEDNKDASGSSSKKLKVTNLTKELLPPNPPSDFDLLPPPPPPPPSPDQALLDLLEECENPVLIVNGDRQPFSVFNTLDRRNFTGMKISSETFPMMEYRQGVDCGVIELNTKNKVQTAKTINDLLLKSKDNKNGQNGTKLNQNEPNPFSNKTTIGFDIPEEQIVSFIIHDISGNVVKRFEEQSYPEGHNEIEINRSDLSGGGVYYISMRSGDFFATKKIIYVEGRD